MIFERIDNHKNSDFEINYFSPHQSKLYSEWITS
jgi:hypothetical protein